MTPLKIFLSLRDWLARQEALDEVAASDVFQHPDIRAMSLRQLADLPFPDRTRPAANSGNPPLAKCA